jgi:hypothetical protein
MKDPYEVPRDEIIEHPYPVPTAHDVGFLGIADYWTVRARKAEAQRDLFYRRLIQERVSAYTWERRAHELETELKSFLLESVSRRDQQPTQPAPSPEPTKDLDHLPIIVGVLDALIRATDRYASLGLRSMANREAREILDNLTKKLGIKPTGETS